MAALDDLDDFYTQTSNRAKSLGPNLKLTSLKEGVKYKQYLNDILERAGGHPIVAFELTKLEEKLKIKLIECAMVDSYRVKKSSNTKLWNEVKEDLKQLYLDNMFEARRLKEEIVKIRENPRLIPTEWLNPSGFRVTKECNDQKVSPLSREMLKENQMVKLSDGHCYNLTDLIFLYDSNTPLQSPITGAPFEAKEKNLMRTLTLKRRPLGYNGRWNGGTRRSRKSRKSSKSHSRK